MTNEELLSLLSLDRSSIPPDGGSRFNRLIFSNSPYLLQHAGNAVDWREWSKDAQQEAKARNLPLFVSIGYSTCHWCHVMAHESFEDEEVADILNNAFIPVKVDREERPDIDQFCMAACQALTGSGGWPLNCFIKPDGTPFYATTYLPREPRQGIPGFLELLENISNVWLHRTDAVERNSSRLMEALSRQTPACAAHSSMTDFKALSDSVKGRMLSMFDREYKGFGSSPKFPMPTWLLFLSGCRETEADTMVVETLMAMRDGGIWDQIGGGIHRYSTDRRWFAPHFEKMLYDQAMVSYACLEAYKHSAETPLLRAAEDILSFAIREMMDRDGGFYSAIDADSEGSEGEFYLWERNEIEGLLKENTLPFMEFFGVSENGNFEHTGKNILQRTTSIQMFAEKYGMTTKDADNFIKNCRESLYEARENRVQPLLDRKIISGWNGLMIAALSKAYSTTGNVLYINAALKTKEFIFRELFTPKGRLKRSFMLSASETPGFLEDYAYLTWGLVGFFNATDAIQALEQCERLALEALDLFRMEDGRLSISGKDFEQMPVPLSELHDGVIPSAVSVFAETMLFLYIKTGNEAWKIELERLFHAYSGNIAENPSSCPLFVAVGEKFTELF